MGRLTKDLSVESLNDRGSSVYKSSHIAGKRRVSEFAAVNRSELANNQDNLRSLNYKDMYIPPEDEMIDRKLLKSPSRDSDAFNELKE